MYFSMKKSCKGKVITGIVIVLILLTFGFTIYRIDKLYAMQVEAYASNVGISVINQAVNNIISNNPQYDKFTYIICNSENKVTAAESNTVLMNSFKSQLTQEIVRLLEENPRHTVLIPLANIWGVAFFSNRGFEIPIIFMPISDIKTNFYDELKNSGINNTKHSLNINVEITLNIVGYFSQKQRVVATTVPVSETIIAGDVPSYYSESGNMGYIPDNIK